jgi:hypothetical protein
MNNLSRPSETSMRILFFGSQTRPNQRDSAVASGSSYVAFFQLHNRSNFISLENTVAVSTMRSTRYRSQPFLCPHFQADDTVVRAFCYVRCCRHRFFVLTNISHFGATRPTLSASFFFIDSRVDG